MTETTETFIPPHQHPVWQTLQAQARRLQPQPIARLFSRDPSRTQRLTRCCGPLLADFSKQRLDAETLETLFQLAEACQLTAGIQALFNGENVNFTEQRPALHMALRGSCSTPRNQTPDNTALRQFAETLYHGTARGATGKPIRRLINLGIGGSDLGPRMAYEALSHLHTAPLELRFVANTDPRELEEALSGADPASTLFILSSKSFTTAETLNNAAAARAWLQAALGHSLSLHSHFAAVSNATDLARAFGVSPQHIFAIPQWVGGRYSLWSAIGLPVLAAIGQTAFDALLAGARAMDEHFLHTAPADNLPILMGLIGLWNISFLNHEALAVLPYAHGLRNFPAWLQQLEMESNGKRTLRDGSTTHSATAPIVWGGTGTIGQHAFHQLFYQGTHTVPLDFIVPVGNGSNPRQRALVDNAIAQSAALMKGRTLAESLTLLEKSGHTPAEAARLAPHLVCPGNQPSTTLLMPTLDPFNLGQLLALYEHKTFVQGWLWGINSFDQYGVELGKNMARILASDLRTEQDSSTTALLAAAKAMQQ